MPEMLITLIPNGGAEDTADGGAAMSADGDVSPWDSEWSDEGDDEGEYDYEPSAAQRDGPSNAGLVSQNTQLGAAPGTRALSITAHRR